MGRSVRHSLRRVGAAAAGLALLVMGQPAPAHAEDANPRTILAAKAYPGIQLIATTYTATVTVAIPTVNQTALNSLVNRLILQDFIRGRDTVYAGTFVADAFQRPCRPGAGQPFAA